MKYFKLPDLAEGLTEAQIIEWYVKEGDHVTVDQPVVAVETAKAIVEIPSPYDGKILEIHGKKGDTIFVGEPLLGFDITDDSASTVVGNLHTVQTEINPAQSEPISTPADAENNAERIQSGITALKNQLGISDSSSPQGKESVCKSTSPASTPPKAPEYEAGNLEGTRRLMAINMKKSHESVVPVSLFDEVNIHHWSSQADITVNLVSAIIHACGTVPILNAWYENEKFSIKNTINLGIAVDDPQGLYVPVIRNVADKDPVSIRAELNRLRAAVRDKSIKPNELSGATLSLSNFGMIAGQFATPIIVPPTVAILGSGKIQEKPMVINGGIKICRILPLSLSFDHRVITGGEATRFLAALIQHLESQ